MKKVLFLTNYPSPYRVQFFDELGKYLDVTVLFSERKEDKTHRSAAWYVSGEGRFQTVQLNRTAMIRGKDLCLDVIGWLKKDWDAIVLCGYASPTIMTAMAWLRAHKRPFYMEVDGGLIREDSKAKYAFKKMLITAASGWLSSGKATTEYLVHYGAKREAVREYPFSSLHQRDLLSQVPGPEEKTAIRQELGLEDGRIVLSIGQFIHRKGFDILLQAAAKLPSDVKIHIVGGEPTQEYLAMCQQLGLNNVVFDGFMKKERLLRYYQAADLFVLPTREDIWGLVINEAMAYGLPVITTDRCVAGLELVEDGVNGYIVPVNDAASLAEKMLCVLNGDMQQMGRSSLEKIQGYTIENMAQTHVAILGE